MDSKTRHLPRWMMPVNPEMPWDKPFADPIRKVVGSAADQEAILSKSFLRRRETYALPWASRTPGLSSTSSKMFIGGEGTTARPSLTPGMGLYPWQGLNSHEYINYGLPSDRQNPYFAQAQTPMERERWYNEWTAQNAAEFETFWPTVQPINNRQSPGKTNSGHVVPEGLFIPNNVTWSGVKRWEAMILSASGQIQSETGVYVPPSVIAAIMQIESGGSPASQPGIGLMQLVNPNLSVPFDRERARTDNYYNIYLGTNALAKTYVDMKARYGAINWTDVAAGYFGGVAGAVNLGAEDSLGTSISDYRFRFEVWMGQLSAATSVSGGGKAPGVGISGIWGNTEGWYISQEFGLTEFAQSAQGRGFYADYAIDRNGKYIGHPALDVGIKGGTRIYSPSAGTVVYVGGTQYFYDAQIGAGVPYSGEFRLRMDNGDELILGHLRNIDHGLYPGQKIAIGQFVGLSGGLNGDHLHLEYRSATDPRRFIDPREVFSGGYFAPIDGAAKTHNTIPGLPDARNPSTRYKPPWIRMPAPGFN